MGLVKPRGGAATAKPAARVGVRGAAPAARAGGFKFQYRGRSAEQVRERAQRSIGGRDSFFNSDVQFFTPRVGDNNVRILPPPPDKADEWNHYGISLSAHYDIGADRSAFLCLQKMKGEECPLCVERDRANSEGEQELADALKPSYRVAVYVIDRAQENKGPMVWNMPAGLDKDITKLCVDPKTGEGLLVDDPEGGYDLMFAREGEGMKTKYKGVQFARHASPLHDDPAAMEKWLQYICEHPLDDSLQFFDADYIAKQFAGTAPPDADEGTDKAPPARVQPRGTRAAAAAAPPPAKPAGRVAIKPRGAAAAPPPEPEPPAGEWPTWDELVQLDEDGLGALIEEAELAPPDDGFESLEELQTWVATELQIEMPAESEPEPPPAPAASKGSWKDRLAKLKK